MTITLSTFNELLQFHSSCLVFRLYRVKEDQILYGGPSPFRASPFTAYQVTNLETETKHGSWSTWPLGDSSSLSVGICRFFVCFFLININGVFNTYYAQKQTFKPLNSAALSHLKTGDLAGSLFTTTSWDGFPSCCWCKFTRRKLLISWNGRSFWLELPLCVCSVSKEKEDTVDTDQIRKWVHLPVVDSLHAKELHYLQEPWRQKWTQSGVGR